MMRDRFSPDGVRPDKTNPDCKPSENRSIPLFLFAKAPVPGKVKTRMQPELGKDGCARVAEAMLVQSAQKVLDHWPGNLVLCVFPDCDHDVFARLVHQTNCEIAVQVGENLGDRMLHALKSGIESSGSAVVMGCDVPHITAGILATTHHALCDGVNVVGPAEDGGFYLLGLGEFRSDIFREISWGTDTVMARLDKQANFLGLNLVRLPVMRDIDRWRDLVWLADHDPRYNSFVAPACAG